jgi:predicted dehydrogenase
MRFALLGNHPDGIQMARALFESGRHELIAYNGPKAGAEELAQQGLTVKAGGDLEEILADPAVELAIVAGKPADRPVQLRRALQSERHVLCVHPADESPDVAYEAGMIQGDTKKVLLPLLTDALSPPVRRLAELLHPPEGPLGKLRFLQLEQSDPDAVLLEANVPGYEAALPCWQLLRAMGGEVIEVSAFAAEEELKAGEPLLLAGKFQSGGLFHATLLPGQTKAERSLRIHATRGTAELVLHSPAEPAVLTWRTANGETHTESFETWNPWSVLVDVFDLASRPRERAESTGGSLALPAVESGRVRDRLATPLNWQDAVRCLELDDAARRSVERRRASTLDYQEVSEEVGFKGTMTLVGCGLLWGVLAVVILAAWERRLLWLVVPVLLFFLGLQLLRWIIPQGPTAATPSPTDTNDRLHAG